MRVTILTAEPADLSAITTTELGAGLYASPLINKPDYRISARGSDTVPDQPLEASGNAVTYGNSNFDGIMTALRHLLADGTVDATNDTLWPLVQTKGTRLWVIEREGPLATQADAAADEYEWFEVITDEPQKPQNVSGYIKRTVPLGVQDHGSGTVAA
ncbi:hypothetical protein OEB99_16525 [Actinotalea sp. M2MS4P-6]|uniref:phage tail tube protein n=1 Tax=Actinotalea sp. M2MS4P-6 TaxID=2983762 RepID=UPI0021E4EEDA|nr:hypothetical protein [Actinotalea sp. M2MS4P-6]MCV2395922.1 hypothetical protein [Actinotalea sp. M2MS4P-6]